MLRTKQLTNLSNNARSFFIGGTHGSSHNEDKSKNVPGRKPISQSPRTFLRHVSPQVTYSKTGGNPRTSSFWEGVESVAHILKHSKWTSATEEALRKLAFKLNAYQANQVLKQVNDHHVALSFFHWLKRQPGYKHDGHTYTTMIGILGKARQFAAIGNLMNQMATDGCKPNVVTYNRLIHSHGRANHLNDAVSVFNAMQKDGCQPDRVTYCTIIDIYAKAGHLNLALEMYRRMSEVGLSPDTFTYSVMINNLGKAGDFPSALRLYNEMVEKGCVPNVVTFNIMIALHAKARNYDVSLGIYRDMKGAGFESDKVTYSIVMEVLGHCGCLSEAENVFEEMKRKNWEPDEPVYGLLVDLNGKSGNVEKAWKWYTEMLRSGMKPNVPTCNSLLNAFLKTERLTEAQDFLNNMLTLGLTPSLQTYTLLLSFTTEAKTENDRSFGCGLLAVTRHPVHEFLVRMPSGEEVSGHVSRFLDACQSEERESKRGLMDAVVEFLQKTGSKEEACLVWEAAAAGHVYPDAVREKGPAYWLINLHVMSEGTATMALCRTLAWLRRRLVATGEGVRRVDIVTGWGRRSRVTGSSLVRRAVEEVLRVFGFPYFTEGGNSGCFVGCGESLSRWLMNPYVERMHLL